MGGLFQTKIEPSCSYCKHGTLIDDELILCMKKGTTTPDQKCGSFKYDPFKRTPPRPVTGDFSQMKDEDFSL